MATNFDDLGQVFPEIPGHEPTPRPTLVLFYRGPEAYYTDLTISKQDGIIYFATDTQKIFVNGQVYSQVLTAGDGISINGNVISCTFDTNLFVFVSHLPKTPDPGNLHKIHVVKSNPLVGSPDLYNRYIEYIWVPGGNSALDAWEKLGEFQADIDLTPYATKEEVESAQNGTNSALSSISRETLSLREDINAADSSISTLEAEVAALKTVINAVAYWHAPTFN